MLLLLSINAYILYVAHLSLHLFTYVLHMVEAVFQTVVFVLMFIRETVDGNKLSECQRGFRLSGTP